MMQMVYMMDSFLMIRWLSWAFRLELRARREGHWYNKIETCRGESKIVDHAQFSGGVTPTFAFSRHALLWFIVVVFSHPRSYNHLGLLFVHTH